MLSVLAAAVELPAPDSAQSIGWLFLTLCAFAAGAYYLICIWEKLTNRGSKTEISGQPVEVKQHPGVVTAEDLNQAHGRISRERDALKADIARVEAAAEKRTDKLEAKIDENTSMTSEMKGQMGQMNQNLHALTTSVTNFLQRQAKQ